MKKITGIFLATLFAISCSSQKDEEGFPKDPTEGQTYTRNDGSRGVWNAMLGYWMISSMVNGRSVTNHYYPATNKFTNSTGSTIERPKHYSKPTSRSKSRSGFGSSSRTRSSARS